MIRKLRKLNDLMDRLNKRGVTLRDIKPNQYTETFALAMKDSNNLSVDVTYERNLMTLTAVSYTLMYPDKKKEDNKLGVTLADVVIDLDIKKEPESVLPVKFNTEMKSIDITQEFLDAAYNRLMEEYKGIVREQILEELVNTRLKEDGLV